MIAPRLVLVTDPSLADAARTLEVVRATLDVVPARLFAVGLRDHEASVRARCELGRALRAILRPRGARLLVHDRVDLALALDADGVQLGARSIDVADARALLPKGALVAKSCHDEAELARAVEERADWATLSPLFASPGKGAPLGEATFARLRRRAPQLPIVALGGVEATNAARAKACGADGVAAIRALLQAKDVAAAARAMLAPFVLEGSDPALGR